MQASKTYDYRAMVAAAAPFVRANAARGEVLIIGATRAAADDLVRLHCGSVAGIHRFTLRQLAATLAAVPLAERGLAPVNHFGIEALAARAVHAMAKRQALEYFGPVAHSPGFPRALARTLNELRLEKIDKSALAETGKPGEDLANLLDLYQGMLAEGRMADFAEILRLATQSVRSGGNRLIGLPLLLLDVPLESTAARVFCEELADRSSRSLVLELEDSPRHESPHATSLGNLRHHLFAAEVTPRHATDRSFDFFSAAGEGLESTEIARRIHALAAEGFAFDEQAIVLRAVERYQPLLEEALTRAGVPFYFTRGSVRPDPAGRAFLALLACAGENYTATRFAEYLSLGQTPSADAPKTETAGAAYLGTEDELLSPDANGGQSEAPLETEPTPATPAAWEKLIVDAAVVGGRARWQRRLTGLEKELQLRLEHLEDADDGLRAHLENQLRLLGNLQKLALPVIERLDALPSAAPWGEWIERLNELAELTLRRPHSVQLAINELQPMAEVGPVSLDEVFLVLNERLRFLRRHPARRRYGQVWIGSIDEARGQSFRAVFLPGLAEGIFPRKAFEDPLLLDEYRQQLEGDLPRRETRVGDERLRLRIAAAAASERLIVSYPRMDVAQGRPRVPSFYAMEAVRAAEGSLPELREFERRAAQGAMTRLGWPAPEEKSRAVDALEFDLASIHEALTAGRGQARGRGRYLMSLNEHAGRSLRQRRLRWGRKWSVADGLMSEDEESRAILGRMGVRERAYSPSTLQHFAACPYRFVLHGIHQLRPREESVPLDEMDPLTRGALFHSTLFRLFPHLKDGGDLVAAADRILDEVAARYEDDLAPAIPRVWRGEVEDLRADLHGWLRRHTRDAAEWEPIHAELAFGLGDRSEHDPASSREQIPVLDGVLLKGSMDWVERHKASGALRVTDHKTGRAPKRIPLRVGGGAVLQPLLYALACEFLLGQAVKLSRLYYSTQRGAFTTIEIPVTEEARRTLAEALKFIDDSIRHASLPAAPEAGACQWCDYALVCGPREEERTRRKQPPAHLVALRGLL